MKEKVEALLQHRAATLAFYSPYNFIREIKPTAQFELFVRPKILKMGASENTYRFMVEMDGQEFIFLYEYLTWDSAYFKKECFKLFTVLFARQEPVTLIKAIHLFKAELRRSMNFYCFMEIPAEDIFLIQCLNEAGLKVVETRLYYYKSELQEFKNERFPVKQATSQDVAALVNVAAMNRNSFDRIHADFSFSEQEADSYLATYAEAAVNGFCDKVIVPNEIGTPVASFLAYNLVKEISQEFCFELAFVRLAAVGTENRGWLSKLISEVIFEAIEQGVPYVLYPTQSVNKAAIKICENLGFRLGYTSHFLSIAS